MKGLPTGTILVCVVKAPQMDSELSERMTGQDGPILQTFKLGQENRCSTKRRNIALHIL